MSEGWRWFQRGDSRPLFDGTQRERFTAAGPGSIHLLDDDVFIIHANAEECHPHSFIIIIIVVEKEAASLDASDYGHFLGALKVGFD